MRPLTASEKRLSIILAIALFLMVNLIVLSFSIRSWQTAKRQITSLQATKVEQDSWLAQKDFWMERNEWLKTHQPAPPASGVGASELLQQIQQSAKSANVRILDQKLPDPTITPDYQEYSVQLRVSGSLEALTKWLTTLQTPEAFIAIPSFDLISDKEPPQVICDLTIAKWYKPETHAP